MDNQEIHTFYRTIKRYFILAIIISTLLFLLSLILTGPIFSDGHSSIILERYSIMITLIAIPISLKVFHSSIIKIKEECAKKHLLKYQKYFFIRLTIIELVCLLNIVALYATGSKNFIYMSIICIFALFLSAPQLEHLEFKEDGGDDNIDEEVN